MSAKLLSQSRPASSLTLPEHGVYVNSPLSLSRPPRVPEGLTLSALGQRTPRPDRRARSPGRSPGRPPGRVSLSASCGSAPPRERRHRKLSLPVIPQQQSLTFPIVRNGVARGLLGRTWAGEPPPVAYLQGAAPSSINFHGSQFLTSRDGGGVRRPHGEQQHRGTGRQLPKIGPTGYSSHSASSSGQEKVEESGRGRSRPQSEHIELALSPGLAHQKIASSTYSLPAQIDCISDIEDDAAQPPRDKDDSRLEVRKEKKRNKLTRRKACYRQKKDQGRSRSLTHIDTLDPAMLVHQEDGDRLSEPDTPGRLHESGGMRRKKLAAHNKVVSSECFSVSFDINSSEEVPEEFVSAVKGTVLREALSQVCEQHRIDIDSISVYLENGRTPLPLLTTETYWLGGKHLRIKVRDHDSKSPVRSKSSSSHSSAPTRKSSGSYRGMVTKLMNSAEETSSGDGPAPGSSEGSLKVNKTSKQHTRWSGIFSNSSMKEPSAARMDQMIQCLDNYSTHGIPRLPYLVNFDGDAAEEEELYNLESDWRELVDAPETLSERRHQQQNAIWELVHTEAAYLHTLKVITDLFLSCLCNLQHCGILTDVSTEKLFSNIQEIYAANRHFWHDHVLRMLTKARKSRQPLDITEMRDGFAQFEEICHPYTRYCLDQNNSKLYCKSLSRSNGLFNGYLAWCETQKDCNRLRLVDILAKPWQRLTKYSLLLKAILKKTEPQEEQAILRQMIEDVDVFVGSVDGSLRSRHEQERLSAIIGRIDSYDCVDTKDDELEKAMKPHLSLDLTCPMPGCSDVHRRYLLLEGELKLRDHVSSKVDVRCFLFTDMLLVCKPLTKKGDKVRVIRQPYVIDRLVVQEGTKDAALLCVYLNEYQLATAAFTLYCSDSRHCKNWVDSVKKAQEKYREARLATINQEYVFYDDDDELEPPTTALMTSRSPRGSSRTSRVPSLIHSHSSSMDNSDPSGVSTLQTSPARAAALAAAGADERLNLPERSASEDHPPARLRGSLSPRTERRPMLRSVGSTPNQLSVLTHLTPAGQSLPNLSAAEAAQQLSVPAPAQRGLQSAQRGVTYPPLSPRTLRRSTAVQPPPRNPPLARARHVTTDGGSCPSPPPPAAAPPPPPPPPAPASETGCPSGDSDEPEPADAESRSRRHSRDRLENRRYHTAGAIEDMKKQESRDASIQKRLSWNCGQQPAPPPQMARQTQALRGRGGHGGTGCLSSDSVHSSSGVSSVNSLHLSIGSEFEEGLFSDNLDEVLAAETDPAQTLVEATNLAQRLKLSPHISTTYISTDELSCAGVSCVSSSVQNTDSGVKIDISEAPDGVLSRVQITVNDGSPAGQTALETADDGDDDGADEQPSPAASPAATPPQWNQFEFLLSDSTIRASDV
ncbi:pleckstrin homology domain-containing family G member 5-like isoform X3 [Amphibalanus amphitrite]|uniref:pleckstrin homology domain-containing family G member 5-like isoform X3 n=1 Tax=Amphibalanus amphitrite TaxID=1232801 RepID=UPI001C91D285|nr:pleckstrin homology domain-containing family G member 5-like isoform X3 [Amphibalanus amphitrite]